MERVYVYSMEATAEELRQKSSLLGETTFWTATLSSFHVGKGQPADWNDQGSVFSPKGEMRWQRNGDRYKALILVDQALEGLKAVDGDWVEVDEDIYLQDLVEPRVRPQFQEYPHGDVKGILKVKTCMRNGFIVAISPREFQSQSEVEK